MILIGQNRSTRTETPSYRCFVGHKSNKEWSWIETGLPPSEDND